MGRCPRVFATPSTVAETGRGARRGRRVARSCSYGEAVEATGAIGQALLACGLGPDRPLVLLSGNGVDHLLMTLGAMIAGVPADRLH